MKTVFFLLRVTLSDLVVSSMCKLPAVCDRKSATNDRPTRSVSPRLKGPTDHSGPVIHYVQSHALGIRRVFRDSFPVIFDQQCAPALLCRQLNQDLPRAAMLDRVVHCFLSDVIEMCGHRVIVNQDRSFALKAT